MGRSSIIQDEEERCCYLCGKTVGLELHHVLAGIGRKRLSDSFGLTVLLCHDCHTGRHGAQYDPAKGNRLKADAQEAFERIYGHTLWMKTFGKNYLGYQEDD